MLEKFLLAIAITLGLKFLLGVNFPTPNLGASSYRLVETPSHEAIIFP